MKIIATTEKGFLLETSKDELARLVGFKSDLHHGNSTGSSFRVGQDVRVNAMFARLYELEQRKGELSLMATQLRAQAGLLESIEPVIEAATSTKEESA